MTLKTLKDLQIKVKNPRTEVISYLVDADDLRQEAIKWVKSDLEFVRHLINKKPTKIIIGRWMKRLNITEKELKEGAGK